MWSESYLRLDDDVERGSRRRHTQRRRTEGSCQMQESILVRHAGIWQQMRVYADTHLLHASNFQTDRWIVSVVDVQLSLLTVDARPWRGSSRSSRCEGLSPGISR